MANMSYCRFENTYSDFSDCNNALEEEGLNSLSERERMFARWMYEKCQEFIKNYEENEE